MRTLIFTVGQSDVQLVKNRERHKFDGNTCGDIHDELNRRGWTLVDTPDQRSRGLITRETLPSQQLVLCTPKLDAVLDYCKTPPDSALVLETSREGGREPRMAGCIVQNRLECRGVKRVERFSYLHGRDSLEDPTSERDAVVRHRVVSDLSKAIGTHLQKENFKEVVVATTGGLAAANELIVELVRLHAVGGPTVTTVEVPDTNRLEGCACERAVPEMFHPAAGYRARWHALSLIERGNLLGAWGAVSHLENVPGQEWVQIIDWLCCFACSLPMPESWNNAPLPFLTHERMAVRAALRVELALRAGDVPRAVHGTIAFFEAALWDGLNEHLERSKAPNRRRYFKFKSAAPSCPKLVRCGNNTNEDRKRPFELKVVENDESWYWVHDGHGGPAARLVQYFLKRKALREFEKALNDDIRALRNDVAHNEPTPELMTTAKELMQTASLWSKQDTFLSQPLVQDVLKELDVENPGSILDELLSKVRSCLCSVPDDTT